MQKCLLLQLGRNIHVYVDDIVVKTKQHLTLLHDLKETFANLREYKVKLNPEKCVFGVPARKLLGFLISERGIEANPEKIKAIERMRKPAQLRNEDEAFRDLKRMLSTAPVLAAPAEKEPLLLYITATSRSVSTVTVVERPEKDKVQAVQCPVYYLSEYFQEHVVTVVSMAPLGEIIGCRDASGRVAKWALELAGHTILYEPRTTIKSQALADFLVDWTETQASNNGAEYEALVHGLWLAKELGIRRILCFGDSDLVVQQCSGEWDARDPNMASNPFLVQKLSRFFEGCEFLHVPCAENEAADTLAKIASSRQSIPSGISLEHLHKPSFKTSPDSESIYVPSDLAAPQPGPGTAEPGLGAAEPGPGATEPGPGTAEPGPRAASTNPAAAPEPAVVAVFTVVTAPSWALPISEFLENGVLPMEETEARQRCVEQDRGIEILLDIHQGECEHHAASRSLVAKAFRHGFYWPMALDDTELLILTCEGCQHFSKHSHQPASALRTIPITWPFGV
ncbi:uncharacterized protein [Aegilops tauschii subsp. strangulata]|uniref:uncharacterized protein n=1 Tax=Aegilops tauschii subsp. strangulata TaxID=200361 RepID=UPI00098BA626|nr:uncharacterized protein LOC109778193 [Aegilops tauschii subsp. strangulata]